MRRHAQAQLGVSRKVLAERLGRMVDDGLLARVPYRDDAQRTRHEYRLIEKGQDLATALLALVQGGGCHMPHPDGRPLWVVDRATGPQVEDLAALSGQPVIAAGHVNGT